jgi:hypothetical protein
MNDDYVRSIFAENLQAGHMIAVLGEGAGRSLFESVLQQVNHLVRADADVLSLWRGAIRKLVSEQGAAGTDIVELIRTMGCGRTPQSIRTWLTATTMAPRDVEDIERVLAIAGIQRAGHLASIVDREIEIV